MKRDKFYSLAKGIVILGGVICFALALVNLPQASISWGFLLVLVFSTVVTPRMSLALPHARFAISFSDAFVFLAFLLYGGPAAILVAIFESIANCLFLRSKSVAFSRMMIPINISINAVSTGMTYLIWVSVSRASFITADIGTTQNLIATLGSLAIVQFAVSSLLAAVFYSLKEGANLFATWRRDCFSSSMTQIVGAGLAGVIYKLVNYGDIVTGAIACLAIGITYLSYRRSIDDVNEAIRQAEDAEREKAEVERNRRGKYKHQ